MSGTDPGSGTDPMTPEPGRTLLAGHTTFRIGGPADDFATVASTEQLIDEVRRADAARTPLLVLSGGSNLLVGDAGFPGQVLLVASRGIRFEQTAADSVLVAAQAGEPWDDLVVTTMAEGLGGLAPLSGIPGLVGSSPVQNVGAYGAEVAQFIESVTAWDRSTGARVVLSGADCGFGYRDSIFKRSRTADQATGRWVVLEVAFRLPRSDSAGPVGYAELARRLGVPIGAQVPAGAVREAVLELRAGKGMVLDPADHDTWSAGSFFTNPLLDAEQAAGLPPEAPRFGQADGRVKSSAAWLIERAGFGCGFGWSRARISGRHSLALTNRGGASAAEVVELARHIRDGVAERFGVRLEAEPVLVGLEL